MTGLPKWSTLINQINNAVNVATATRTNIMIDVLTQGAYTERRSTLSNHGATALVATIGANNRIGKFFPRGCRGFIKDISLYCKNTTGAGGEITVFLSPYPAAGPLYEVDIELNDLIPLTWETVALNKFWNYDSLFLSLKSEEAYVFFAYDAEELPDGYQSDDVGVTYTNWANRLWARVVYLGQTIGDIPIVGTVNTINIPNTFTGHSEGLSAEVDGGSSVVLLDTIYGMGSLDTFMVKIYKTAGTLTDTDIEIKITIDGTEHTFEVDTLKDLVNSVINTRTPISFFVIDDSNVIYGLGFNFKMVYRQSLKIECPNVGSIGEKFKAYYMYSYSMLR